MNPARLGGPGNAPPAYTSRTTDSSPKVTFFLPVLSPFCPPFFTCVEPFLSILLFPCVEPFSTTLFTQFYRQSIFKDNPKIVITVVENSKLTYQIT